MKLYHGSTVRIERPDTAHSRRNLDFGSGFYLTSHQAQAERWAKRKAALEKAVPYVNVYEFNEDVQGLSFLALSDNDASWVEFVCRCRKGSDEFKRNDVIVGGVADDKVFEAVNMYYRGLWDMETTLEALRYYEKNDQYCFTSQRAIDAALSFVESYEVAS